MKKRAKRALALALAAIMLLSLVACGGNNSTDNGDTTDSVNTNVGSTDTGEVKYKERAVIGYSSTLSNKDPHASNDVCDAFVYRLTHDTIVDYIPDTAETRPGLAESWEVDGLTYTFHLRKGVTFHNGNPFTAEDVVYSFDRMAVASATKANVTSIASTEIVDDYTVKFTLKAPNAEFLSLISGANMVIVSKKAVEELGDTEGAAIGTGAFSLTEWVPEEYCLVTRNDNYWGEAPVTKEIMIRNFAEASARVIALQTGEIDVDLAVSAADVAHIEEDSDCRLVTVPAAKLVYLALNVNGFNEALLDVRVRQALNYATNPEEFVIAIREGHASVPNGCIPVGIYGYSDSVNAYTYDVEKAKALLAEAGYGDGLDLALATNSATYPGIFEVLQAQWARAGVNLTLATDDKTIYNDMAASAEYDIMVRNYNFVGIGKPLLNLWYSGSANNRTKTADPKLDAMLDAAQAEMDVDKREAMYAEISQYLTDLGSFIPMYQDQLLLGERNNVSGVFYSMVTHHNLQNIAITVE